MSVKINKLHGGKEFSNRFTFAGKVKPARRKEGESWEDIPFYQISKTKTNKDRKVLQFVLETAKGNELKLELAGMEKEFVYAYSQKEKKTIKVLWKDRNKELAAGYYLLQPEWDALS